MLSTPGGSSCHPIASCQINLDHVDDYSVHTLLFIVHYSCFMLIDFFSSFIHDPETTPAPPGESFITANFAPPGDKIVNFSVDNKPTEV